MCLIWAFEELLSVQLFLANWLLLLKLGRGGETTYLQAFFWTYNAEVLYGSAKILTSHMKIISMSDEEYAQSEERNLLQQCNAA